MTDFINLIGITARLRQLQERTMMTNNVFCAECGIPPSTYSQILSGKARINIETLNKIIQRWGKEIDPLWLLFGEEPYGRTIYSAENEDGRKGQIAPEVINEIVRLRAELTQNKPKRISKILVYYTDKSYESYSLDPDKENGQDVF